MTLLSEIYDVTLKRNNRNASINGYVRPTVGECFKTNFDYSFVEALPSYMFASTPVATYESGMWQRVCRVNNNVFITATTLLGSPTFNTYRFENGIITLIDSMLAPSVGGSVNYYTRCSLSEIVELDTNRFAAYYPRGRMYDIRLNSDGSFARIYATSTYALADSGSNELFGSVSLATLGDGLLGYTGNTIYSSGYVRLHTYDGSGISSSYSQYRVRSDDTWQIRMVSDNIGEYVVVFTSSTNRKNPKLHVLQVNGASVTEVNSRSLSSANNCYDFVSFCFLDDTYLAVLYYNRYLMILDYKTAGMPTKKSYDIGNGYGGRMMLLGNNKFLHSFGQNNVPDTDIDYRMNIMHYDESNYTMSVKSSKVMPGSNTTNYTGLHMAATSFCMLSNRHVVVNSEDKTKILSINN